MNLGHLTCPLHRWHLIIYSRLVISPPAIFVEPMFSLKNSKIQVNIESLLLFFFWYVTFSKYINWNVKYDNIIYFIQSQLNSKNNYPRLTMSLEIVSLVLENTFMIFRISGSIKSVLYKSRLYNMFGGGYVVWICQLISSKWEMGRREIPMTQFGFKWSKYNSFHIHTAWFLV